jgi:hypothetical protein
MPGFSVHSLTDGATNVRSHTEIPVERSRVIATGDTNDAMIRRTCMIGGEGGAD